MGGRKVYYCWVVQRFGIVKAGSGGSEILPFLTSGGKWDTGEVGLVHIWRENWSG
jgi:hypothetical protein